jgi:hypothetical protein
MTMGSKSYFASDRLEEVVMGQARLIEMYILQRHLSTSNGMSQSGLPSCSASSKSSEVNSMRPGTYPYFRDASPWVTLSPCYADTSISTSPLPLADQMVPKNLQIGERQSSVSTLAPTPNTNFNDYIVDELSLTTLVNLFAD